MEQDMKAKRMITALLLIAVLTVNGCGLFPEQGPYVPGEQVQPGKTLWNKSVTMEKLPVPQEAFAAGGAEVCRGMAPDGVTFLMTNNTVPYLYNTETHTKMPLVPDGTAAVEAAREIIARSGGSNQTTEEYAKARDYADSLEGEALTEALCGLYTKNGSVSGPNTAFPPLQTTENYMAAYTFGNFPLLIDCNTGRYRIFTDGMPVAVQEGKALLHIGGIGARIVDLAAGQEKAEDFTAVKGYEDASVTGVGFLPDGSVCAVLRYGNVDVKKKISNTVVVVRDTDGKDTCYPLGTTVALREPNFLTAVGADTIIASSPQYSQVQNPYMIDRKTGTVSILGVRDLKVEAVPLQAVSSGDTPPDLSKAGASMVVLDAMSDGETALLWGMETPGELLLYRPSAGETQGLVPDDVNSFPAPVVYNSNHYDRFWMNSWNSTRDYTQLTVK